MFKKYFFSTTSIDPIPYPLPLIIVFMLFYMYQLDKRRHQMRWYFTCNHFSLFKTPYIICNFFVKFIYNEYSRPYFLSHVVSTIFASAHAPPPLSIDHYAKC
jgi:hypothetical protein